MQPFPSLTIRHPGRRPLQVVLDGELEFGRDCDGFIVVDGEVSRSHVRFRPVGDAVEVVDLGSTNGTFIDGEALNEPRLVVGGTVVSIGSTTIGVGAAASRSGSGIGRETIARPVDLRMTSIDVVEASVTSSTEGKTDSSNWGPTTTIFFSDIESSTQRATEMGDRAWLRLLEEHNSIFRSSLQTWNGKEIKTIGDAFMLTFPSVRQGLRFAIEVQERISAPTGPDLRVRMGLHTGEALIDLSGDLFGRHVSLAARVANLAGGGEIVASTVVKEIAAGMDDIEFGPPFIVELKGFTEQEAVHQVLWDR